MGKHLKESRKIDRLLGEFRKSTIKLLKLLKKDSKKQDKQLATFAFCYALTNYNFAIYLMQNLPKAVEADKVDKQFKHIMKNFNKRERK